jgi:hypothetical protein
MPDSPKETSRTFADPGFAWAIDIAPTGHIVGKQYSIMTDEPLFRDFTLVMEGNNEVDIDGQPRRLDYLGTEDSFTFSWGFQRPFAGLRAGMTLLKHDLPSMLSIYRFHDHQPVRFNKSLRWHVNWSQERGFLGGWDKPSEAKGAPFGAKWAASVAKGGCWVAYATVHYWYQTVPGGYRHDPLPPAAERAKLMLRPASGPPGKTP